MSKSDDRIKWFSFYPLQFSQDENVILMTNEQVGVYIRLLCHEWTEGSIPEDTADLAGIVHTSPENMAAMWPRLSRCFVAGEPGRLLNPRLEEERAVSLGRKRGSVTGGVASAKQRMAVQDDLGILWDGEKAFAELWTVYPTKGRVRRPASKGYFDKTVLSPEDFAGMMASIRPGGKWAQSEKWAKGFVMSLPEWIKQECWREDPEQVGRPSGSVVAETAKPVPFDTTYITEGE